MPNFTRNIAFRRVLSCIPDSCFAFSGWIRCTNYIEGRSVRDRARGSYPAANCQELCLRGYGAVPTRTSGFVFHWITLSSPFFYTVVDP